MEDKTRAIFVSPLGDDVNPGTRGSPVKTVVRGLGLATTMGGGADVYISNGTYNETIGLQEGVSMYGGFATGTWLRDPANHPVMLTGGTTMITVLGLNVSNVTIGGLRISTPPEALATGLSVHTIFLRQTQNITITNNQITAGDAGPGSGGQFGFPGVGGLPGTVGANASCPNGGPRGAGGVPGPPNAGSQLGVAGGDGGDGGSVNVSGEAGVKGNDAGVVAGGGGGAGGTSAAPAGVNGTPGTDGADGLNGTGGAQIGTLSTAGYVPAHGTVSNNQIVTNDGGEGGLGGVGGNGGPAGLGAPGGNGCNGGGNGGQGGRGGRGGHGGHGGGGGGGPSIGIVKDAASTVTIGTNTYQIGSPGAGGFSQGTPGAGGVSAQTFTMP